MKNMTLCIDTKFSAIIGILPSERVKKQEISLKARIKYKYKGDFIDYVALSDMIKNKIIENKYDLLENALKDISKMIFKKYSNITQIKLKILKLESYKDGILGVKLVSKREKYD